MCTFEECDLKLFADRHAWFNHELECHRLEWCCRFCSHPSFGSETKLSAHMRHQHAQFSFPSQLPALIKASKQSVDRIPATACPLCHWDATLRDLNKHTTLDETLVVTLEQFCQHLGAHMEQLALFALPRSYKEEEGNANSNEAAAMAHSDSQSRHLSTEEMSWKTLSSREVTSDKAIPDVSTSIAPDVGVHRRDSYPWSRKPLDMSKCNFQPFPSFKAAVSQRCSKEGDLYVQGGQVNLSMLQNVWTIETNGTSTCNPIWTNSRGPGPRSYHAALLVGNTFIVFGGLGRGHKSTDNVLFLMNTSEVRPALSQSKTDLARHTNLVDSCTSYKTFC